MTAGWPVHCVEERVYVAGVGLGKCLGRQPDGAYLVDFPHYACVVACVPSAVFELATDDHRLVCAFSIEAGRA